MRFDCTIIKIEAKSEKCTIVRVRRRDSIYQFLAFNQDVIAELKRKVGKDVSLNVFPTKENNFNGRTEPSSIYVLGFKGDDRRDYNRNKEDMFDSPENTAKSTATYSEGQQQDQNDEALPF